MNLDVETPPNPPTVTRQPLTLLHRSTMFVTQQALVYLRAVGAVCCGGIKETRVQFDIQNFKLLSPFYNIRVENGYYLITNRNLFTLLHFRPLIFRVYLILLDQKITAEY